MSTTSRRRFLQAAGAAALSGRASRLFGKLPPESGFEAPRQEASRPNILLLFPDQFRFDCLSGYSSNLPVETPNLTRLAKHGIWFRRATVPSPLCAPLGPVWLPAASTHAAGTEQSSGLSAYPDHFLFPAAVRRLSRSRVWQNRPSQENS